MNGNQGGLHRRRTLTVVYPTLKYTSYLSLHSSSRTSRCKCFALWSRIIVYRAGSTPKNYSSRYGDAVQITRLAAIHIREQPCPLSRLFLVGSAAMDVLHPLRLVTHLWFDVPRHFPTIQKSCSCLQRLSKKR